MKVKHKALACLSNSIAGAAGLLSATRVTSKAGNLDWIGPLKLQWAASNVAT